MQAKVGNFESLGLPVFWHGDVMAHSTFSLAYQRTAFRTERYFSLDWGASFTYFHSYNDSDVYALIWCYDFIYGDLNRLIFTPIIL